MSNAESEDHALRSMDQELKSSLSDAPEADKTPEYIEGARLHIVLASLTLVCFLVLLDMSIIATAVPQITTEFESLGDIAWYGAAYNLASSAFQPLAGRLYTHFKIKWTFVTFLLVFIFGSLLCGVAVSSKMLIVGRAVAGLGTSGLNNGALTIIAKSVPLHRRPPLTSMLISISQLGVVVGPLLGGAITEYSTWRWCFYLNLPVGALAALIIVFTKMPDHDTNTKQNGIRTLVSKLDLPGFAIFAPAAIMLLLALEYGGQEYSWSSATVIGLLTGSVVAFVIFFGWEHRQGLDAMFPLALIAKREIWTSNLISFISLGGLMVTPSYFIPIYFQSVGGLSPLMSGVYTLPSILSSMVFGIGAGFLIGKLGFYIPWVAGGAIVSAVGQGLFTTLQPSTPRAAWIGYQILLGVGRGCLLQMPLYAMQANLPPQQIPVGLAVMIFAQAFGGAILLSVANTIFANNLRTDLLKVLSVVDAEKVIQAGANGFRRAVTETQLPGVLQAFSDSLDLTFWIGVAAACSVFCLAWGMGWKDIRKKAKAPGGENSTDVESRS